MVKICQSKKVLILYRFLPQYRKEFYQLLKDKLSKSNIELDLIYGNGSEADRKKEDLIDLPWGTFKPNTVVKILGQELYWQPVLKDINNYDLIIVEQASKLLVNYYLQLRQIFNKSKLGIWGHGRSFKATKQNFVGELLKRYTIKCATWWFAYTDITKDVVVSTGFPKDRVTVVQNAIDTKKLREQLLSISDRKRKEIRKKYGIESNNSCIYCGSLYKEKKIDFLIESAQIIRKNLPDFELVIIGSGEESKLVKTYAEKFSWIKYLGSLFGQEKVDLFSICRLQLMPGLVGLAILDSFTLGVPIVTTDIPIHSPEIFYLKNGVNGVKTNYNIYEYAHTVISLLEDSNRLISIRQNALVDSHEITVENMVKKFYEGIIASLEI